MMKKFKQFIQENTNIYTDSPEGAQACLKAVSTLSPEAIDAGHYKTPSTGLWIAHIGNRNYRVYVDRHYLAPGYEEIHDQHEE